MEKIKELSFKGNLNVEGSFMKTEVVKLLERHRDFVGNGRVVVNFTPKLSVKTQQKKDNNGRNYTTPRI